MIKTLEGIRIIDFTVAGSGPSSTRLLAEYGAEVIMLEALGGVNTRTFWEFDYYDPGKKSLPVNLKSEDGRKIVYELVKDADVFVTNFRLKAIAKLGLDYESLKKINPGIVYATLTGYGEEGPEKDSPGYDFVSYWSEAGLLNSISDPDGTVLVPLTGYGDPICGKTLTMGICAALYHKAVTGEGMEVRTSLLSDGVYQNHTPIIEGQFGNKWPKTRKKPESALRNTYKCRDGWFYLAADKSSYYAGLFRAAQLPQLAENSRWKTMEDAAGESGEELVGILDEAFKDFFVDGAIDALTRAGVPAYKMATTFDAIRDPQAAANTYWQESKHDDGKRVMIQASPVRFGDNEAPAFGALPGLGEQTVEILRGAGFTEEEIEKFIKEKTVVAM